MSLVVPLVLNIVYGSYSLLWPINIADMNIYYILVIFACQRLIPVPTGAPFGSSEKGCQLVCLLEFGSGAL